MAAELKILVVDPHRDSADSLVELFNLEGHKADAAYDSERGVAAWMSGGYNIAFMENDSYRAAKALDPLAKVYLMTGHSVEQIMQHAARDAKVDMLGRPGDARLVVEAVDALRAEGIVLVAEDDPDLGPQLRQLIESTGRRCELVSNGEQALARVADGGVDVLVLDLNMPLVNGIEVYTQLRDKNISVPTVMITACSDAYQTELDALNDIERTGILHKPFDPSILLSKLERLAA